MTSFLARFFIKNRTDTSSPDVRNSYGVLFGGIGIFLNILLFIIKLAAGIISGSIAITADALNNLADSGSSIVTLLGFKISGKKADHTHPFGHGRFEYVSGLIVSLAIIVMGFELGVSSVKKLFAPTEVEFSLLVIGILAVSIIIKLYMYLDGMHLAKRISSPAIRATSTDSLSDTLATTVVLVSMLISRFTSFNADSWCGCAVAIFIMYSGVSAAKDTISPLLGQPPSPEFVNRITDIVSQNPAVLGIHDLIVHDYGPGRMLISLHAEVSASADFLETHDVIDNIERELTTDLGCHAVIHMDPIADDDQLTSDTREKVELLLTEHIDPRITLHDFRMVIGPTHTNVIFDIVVPYDLNTSETELIREVSELVRTLDGNYFAVVNIDKSFL